MLESQSTLTVELRRHHQNDDLFFDSKLWCAVPFIKKTIKQLLSED